jgi:hypothetical protein
LMIEFRIRYSNFSIVRGFAQYTSSFAQSHKKVTGREIWTSCRPFVRSSSSQPTSRNFWSNQVRTLSEKCGGAHTIDAGIIKSYFVTYIYTLLSWWLLWYYKTYSDYLMPTYFPPTLYMLNVLLQRHKNTGHQINRGEKMLCAGT